MYSLDKFVYDLETLLGVIKKLEDAIESELRDDESPYIYESDCVISGISLKGKSYKDIEYILDYIAGNSDLDDNLALRSKLEKIKVEFIDMMISDLAFEDYCKSYSLFSICLELVDKIEELIKNGYTKLNVYYCICSKKLLDSLKTVVTIDLVNAQRKINNLCEKKDNSWLKRKLASSEYVKRNKK